MSTSTTRNRIIAPAFVFALIIASVAAYLYLGGHSHIHTSAINDAHVADSASITRWDVIPAGNPAGTYTIFKDTGVWKVRMVNHAIADADLKIVSRSLKHLSKFMTAPPARLDKSKWKAEELDNNGTRVVVYVGRRITDTFIISKLEFIDQYKSSYYIRKINSDQVYLLTETYLGGSVIAQEQNFRKKEMAPVSPEYFKTIRIVAPDTNVYYLLENVLGKWELSGHTLDQAKVNAYAKMLTMIQIPAFAPVNASTVHAATILINTRYGDVKLFASKVQDDKWVLSSSVNVGNSLILTTAQVHLIFPDMHFFLP